MIATKKYVKEEIRKAGEEINEAMIGNHGY